MEVKINGIYKHFKGDYYIVVEIASDADTKEDMVIYRSLYGEGKLWVRKKSEFLSPIDKVKYPDTPFRDRFTLIEVKSQNKK